jgi:hypothetical protein
MLCCSGQRLYLSCCCCCADSCHVLIKPCPPCRPWRSFRTVNTPMCLPAVKVGYCWYVCFEIRKPWPFNSGYVTHDPAGSQVSSPPPWPASAPRIQTREQLLLCMCVNSPGVVWQMGSLLLLSLHMVVRGVSNTSGYKLL